MIHPRRQSTVDVASPWKSILERDSSHRRPWDPSKIPSIVSAGVHPRATVEARLRSAFTLRRAIESATPQQRVEAVRQPLVRAALHYFLDHQASEVNPASCARLQEHALFTIVHALGNDVALDEELIFDAGAMQRIRSCLESSYVVVVAAASQLVRRVSELDHICPVLAFDDAMLQDILVLLDTVSDARIRTHILSTLINMAAHPKLQFMLARSARLVQWLVDSVFAFTRTMTDPDSRTTSYRGLSSASRPASSPSLSESSTVYSAATAIKSVRVLANLLSHGPNRAEVQRIVPTILDAMLNCQHANAPDDLIEVSKCVVHLLHENPTDLQFELTSELARRPIQSP